MTTYNLIHPCYSFALVKYSYDYHEFEEVIAVSFDKEKLVHEYEKEATEDYGFALALASKDERENLQKKGTSHFCIEPIKFLE